jgi:hypothetical protein
MASVSFDNKSHDEWMTHFSSRERDALVNDDLSAGLSVALVLVGVITTGALLMVGTVIYTLL